MKKYININDVDNLDLIVQEALAIKKAPFSNNKLGTNKVLGMLFFNPSLRTRLSTQKAAINLGMDVMVINFKSDSWTLEFADGTIMNAGKSEHIKEAAQVISQYCDIIAIRAFALLESKEQDYAEEVLSGFEKYASVPIVNMESATAHPLQGLTDTITIKEYSKNPKPKVVLTWAPHLKPLPHAVSNSFINYASEVDCDFVLSCPEGYELDAALDRSITIMHNQEKAFEDADFVYAKSWASNIDYGKLTETDKDWQVTAKKMGLTNNGKFMHCLPVRRNVVVEDEVLDSEHSIVIQQANNRTYAAQVVLKRILENLES
ncbi:N-acetylornithine carbamoyltransferase [Spongiivirga citrea]|uniref:N-succinylornithine carbamoyltransferase n=1 Tax=Spongiivirga citrea TaxID=1481457 RepID=A0A6M0CHF4_9FLAO|nr:N-acetylornithine carbamoyltransferase [Spongiivirga citrea]NER16393.1 N-acetylornithine carbamoyltransferase [Spongiivirga citrea]